MKTLILFFTTILSLSLTAVAQNKSYSDSIINESPNTLWVINLPGNKQLLTQHFISTFDVVQNLNVLSPSMVKSKYPSYNVQVVMEFDLKQSVKLLTLNQLFDKFRIKKKHRNYTILCENVVINNTADVIANEKDISEMIINTDKHFINIITTQHNNTINHRKKVELESQKLQIK